jgi:hypothetical protein
MKITDMLWILCALVIVFFIGRLTAPSYEVIKTKVDTLYKYNTVTLTDTIHNWLPTFDTVFTIDTIYPIQIVERLDTLLTNEKDSISLQIERHSLPYIYYNLNYKWAKTSEKIEVIKEVYIQQSETWLNKFSIGLGFGYGVNFKGDVSPTVNLGINYKLIGK